MQRFTLNAYALLSPSPTLSLLYKFHYNLRAVPRDQRLENWPPPLVAHLTPLPNYSACGVGSVCYLSALKTFCVLGRAAIFIFLNICLKYFVRASKTIPVFIFYIFLITMIYLLITSVSG